MSFNFYSCISLAVALSVLSFTVQTNAQPQAAPPDPQVWTLDFQNNHCIISTGEVARAGLALWMTPGDPDPTLDLVGSPNIVPAARSVTEPNRTPFTITFSPGGETFQSTAFELSNGGKQRAVELRRLHRDFAAAFAKSDELTARSLQKTVSVPILGSAKAMAALHQCLDQKLAQWGVDVASYDALRMPPTDDFDHPWITYQDYPEQALASDQSGQVVVRLNVDEAGKVTGCAVVASSGSPSIDQATCNVATRRGRFTPAIGPDGRPTAATRISAVDFKLYD